MKIDKALEKLYSMHQFNVKLGLDNIKKLLTYIDNPHIKFKSFHIAGTNGKGSTASFLSSILTEAGYKTGLYTSPHFVKFNERIRINGIEIPDEYIITFMNELNDYIDKFSPTFFEITTALAFKYFSEQNIEYAVIETGLGGRLDATNVLTPISSTITSISQEHTRILGERLDQIAYEKAGIIKDDGIVILGIIPSSAEKVLVEKAQKGNNIIYKLSDYVNYSGNTLNIRNHDWDFRLTSTPLPGIHQIYNAGLAVLALQKSIGITDSKHLENGIKNVVSNSGIQGRYEVYNNYPRIIFDAAHNPESIRAFTEVFKKEYKAFSEKILIFGAMKDKNISKMLLDLHPYFDKFYFCSINYERAAPKEELLRIAQNMGINSDTLDDPVQLIKKFESIEDNLCLVVLGSIYLLGEIKEKLLNKRA